MKREYQKANNNRSPHLEISPPDTDKKQQRPACLYLSEYKPSSGHNCINGTKVAVIYRET